MLLPCIYTHHLFKTKFNCYFGAMQHRNDLQVQLTTWSTMELTQVCMVYLTIDCSINAKLGGWKSPRLESTFSLPAILETSKTAATSKYITVLLRDA